jgi:hypothetical protein
MSFCVPENWKGFLFFLYGRSETSTVTVPNSNQYEICNELHLCYCHIVMVQASKTLNIWVENFGKG